MGNTFFDSFSNEGKNTVFGLPFTEELTGRSAVFPDGSEILFGEEPAVKCDDDLFLAAAGGKTLLVEELPDESLKALDADAETAEAAELPFELEGWETDLCLSSGYVLTAVFQEGRLTLRPSPEPVVANPFSSNEAPAAAKKPEPPAAPPVSFALKAVKTGDKRFLLSFPETGEIIFLDARRFLLYGILRGRIVTGFVEIPPKA